MKSMVIALVFALCSLSASASEYCLDRYDSEIRGVSVELSDILRRQDVLQSIIVNAREDKDGISKEMVDILKQDPGLSIPANRERMVHLSGQFDILDRKEAEAKAESFKIQDRVFALKNVVPANLAGKLRGCVEAVKPVNTLVNTVIQALAILSTGGASLALPPKALYIDMGQVLNGYPLGGPESVVNQAREAVLNALGIGGKNNDVGKIIKDPARVIRCIFGC
ncbi:hypothetical protein [Lysobacter capsici]|uniref:hypothetical protein n=1 Tax=Lysobacter capsici TaxID=435897 RepID=UPI0012907BAB|nr:hypothetical protein [Lysobacter capsici]